MFKQFRWSIAIILCMISGCTDVVLDEPEIEPVPEITGIQGRVYYPHETFRADPRTLKFQFFDDTLNVAGAEARIGEFAGLSTSLGKFEFEAAVTYPAAITVSHPHYETWTGIIDSAGQALSIQLKPLTTPWLSFAVGESFAYQSSESYRSQDGTYTRTKHSEHQISVQSIESVESETHYRFKESTISTETTSYPVVGQTRVEVKELEPIYTTLVVDSLTRIIGATDLVTESGAIAYQSVVAIIFANATRTKIAMNMPVFLEPEVTYYSASRDWTVYSKEHGIIRTRQEFGTGYTKVTAVNN